MGIEGIYERLISHWEKNGYKFFEEQDIHQAGKEDCEELYLNDPLEGEVKSQLANAVLEKLFADKDKCKVDKDIIDFINEYPIVNYYFTFIDKLKIMMKEDMITCQEIYGLALEYIKNNYDVQGIKLGLALLRLANNEEALKILKAYAAHNEFTFFAVEGIKEYPKCNSIIFEIAKNARGYGKILSVTNLEPINKEVKEWIMEKGCDNEFLEPILLALTYSEDEYFDYFFSGRKTRNKYDLFTKKLKKMSELKGFFNMHIDFNMIVAYWEYYKRFKKSFDSVHVMCLLLSLIEGPDKDDKRISEYLSLSKDDRGVIDTIESEFLNDSFVEIVDKALNDISYDINDVLDVALALDIPLKFEDFDFRLAEEPLNLPIYNYMIKNCTDGEMVKLIEFSKDKIPFEIVAQGPEIIDDTISLEYVPDSCLYLIVVAINSMVEEYMDITLKALKARYLPTRKAAFDNLKKLPFEKQDQYIKYVEELCQNEEDNELKGSLLRFLHEHKNTEKRREYEKIGTIKVNPHNKDVFLTETKIAGIKYVDLTVDERNIRKDEQVFLKREKDNPYDSNAIKVLTKSGYVIGYIPKKDNVILKNLMDWGKVIYGIITKVDSDYSNIEINLYLSYIDVIREVADTVNMVSLSNPGYLN